jgi:hypothetical protein
MLGEKRRDTRAVKSFPIIYAGGDGSPEARFVRHSETIDIGVGGVRFKVFHLVEPEDILDLDIFLGPSSEPLALTSKVCWRKRFNGPDSDQVGACFLDIGSPQHLRLVKLIKEYWKARWHESAV